MLDVELAGGRVASGDGLVEQAQALGRQLADHPARAARQPSRQHLPVHELQRLRRRRLRRPRRGDLIANRAAERAGQVARGGPPLARVETDRRGVRHWWTAASTAAASRDAWLIHAPLAGDRSDRVGELLGRESTHLWSRKDVAARLDLGASRHRRHLIRARRQDALDHVLEVVAVLDEIAGDRVEQRGAPRLAIHLVGVADDAVAEEALPEAIDDRAGEPPVARIGEDRRRGGAPIGQRRRRRLAAQLRVEKPRLGVSILRDVTAIQPEPGLGREEAGERVRILQLPLADEAVVAGVALQVDAQEDLRGVLRGLHPGRDRGARLAAPVHADEEPLGIGRERRVDQFVDELIVGQVRLERWIQPIRNALSARRL